LAIKFEVNRDASAIEHEQEIFSAAAGVKNMRSRQPSIQERGRLRSYSNFVDHTNTMNLFPLHKRAQRSDDSFNLRCFRHKSPSKTNKSILQIERVQENARNELG
jgi:hypothetical protein